MATINDLNVAIGAEIGDLDRKLTQASAKIEAVGDAAKQANQVAGSAFAGLGDSAAAASGRYVDAAGRMREANGRFVSAATLAAEAAGGLNAPLGRAQGAAGGLASTINGQLVSAFQRFDKEREQFDKGIGRLAQGLKDAGGSLSTYVTLPLGVLAGAALKVGADFEQGMNRVQAATLASGAELTSLKDKAKDIALDPRLKFSAQDAAGALEMLAKNGVTTTNILGGAADAAVNLATATGGQLATSADIATDVLNNFNLSAKDLADSVDSIAGTTIASKLDIDNYRQALGQAGGVAGQLGVSFSDFNTALASTSSGFSSGSDAGTSFKTFLQRLVPQSKEAAEAMQKLGLNFFDAQGKMRPLREIAGELQTAFKGLSDQQRNEAGTKIFGADSIRTALLLAKQGTAGFDEMAASIGKVKAASQGAILSQGFSGALEGAKSALEGLGIAIAESGILEFGTRLLKSAAGVISSLAELNPGLLQAAVILGGVAAAIGPVLVGVGSLGVALPALSAGFAVLGISAGPVGIALAAIAAAAYLVIDNWDEVSAYFTKGEGGRVFDQLASSLSEVGNLISSLFSPVVEGLTGSLSDLGDGIDFVKVALDLLTLPIRLVVSTFSGLIEIIFGVNDAINGLTRLDLSRAMDGLNRSVSGALRPLMALRGATEETAKRPANEGMSDYFAGLTNNALNALQPVKELNAALSAVGSGGPLVSAAPALTDDQVKALEKLNEELRQNQLRYQVLGESYDVATGKQRILQSGVESLLSVGFAPAGKVVAGFAGQLLTLPAAIEAIETPLTAFIDKINKLAASREKKEFSPFGEFDTGALPTELPALDNSAYLASQEQVSAANGTFTSQMATFNTETEELLDSLSNSFTDFGIASAAAFGQVLVGALGIGDAMRGALAGALGILSDFLKEYAKKVIALGIANLAINPVKGALQIAGGLALAAAAGAAGGIGAGLTGRENLAGGGAGTGISTPRPPDVKAQKLEIKVQFEPVVMRQEGPALVGVLNVSSDRIKRFS